MHRHAGTQIETRADVERMLAISDAGWCFDSGHLLIGGTDPTDFGVATATASCTRTSRTWTRASPHGCAPASCNARWRPHRPGCSGRLASGDARIDEVVDLLSTAGYERWLVLEQDIMHHRVEPPVGRGPVIDVRTSIDYLHSLAPTRRERVADS